MYRLPLSASSAGTKKHHDLTALLRCYVTTPQKHPGKCVSLNLKGASLTHCWLRAWVHSQMHKQLLNTRTVMPQKYRLEFLSKPEEAVNFQAFRRLGFAR